jgi:hypothetical protein
MWAVVSQTTTDTVMTGSEAEAFVIGILKDQGPLSTMEIERIASMDRKRCPDQTVIFLMKMQGKGLIEGEVSIEKRGWMWRVPSGETAAQTPPG